MRNGKYRVFVITGDPEVWIATEGFLFFRNPKRVAYSEVVAACSWGTSLEFRVKRKGVAGKSDDDADTSKKSYFEYEDVLEIHMDLENEGKKIRSVSKWREA